MRTFILILLLILISVASTIRVIKYECDTWSNVNLGGDLYTCKAWDEK